jgi:two-component system CheB/CheR fusion protein
MSRSPKNRKETRKGGAKKGGTPEKPRAGDTGEESPGAGIDAPPAATAGGQAALPVVGIVASAGGLNAFVKLLDALPAKCDMAFVLIPHLDPKRESLMPGILARHTRLPVVTASDGASVAAGHVYVIPPDRVMTIGGGVLRLAAADPRSSPNALDLFLRSLAEDQQENAIGIVLSGTGSSGTAGIKEIKSVGGMVIVQEPATAEQDAMPRSAIATGLVDYVLPPEKMPQALLSYVAHYFGRPGGKHEDSTPVEDAMTKVLALLRARSKLDFRSYRKRMLQRRIQRRMGLAQIRDMEEYLALLRERPEEIKQLAKDLFISVTSFFRDRQMFEILETQVIPELLRDKPADEPLRVWVPACATGEEAYSLAMIFLEQIAASGKACPLQVFASDVEPEALDAARRGVYADSVLADVGGSRLARFFTRADPNHYQVNKTLRDAVLFAQQNILSDAPFSRIDLLSCRNFLIYLESEIQQKVVSLMHFALNEGGYLVLGPSESTATHAGLFEPVSKKWRIYRSLGAGRPVRPELPAEFYASNGSGARPQAPERVPGGIVPEELVRQELLADAPASVLIGRDYEVLYFHGATNRYLEQPSGRPTRSLLALTSESLRSRVRAAAHRAQHGGRRVSVAGGKIKRNGHVVAVTVSAKPLRTARAGNGLVLITFEDEAATARERKPRGKAAPEESVLQQLESELKSTREDLQSTIEELEASNEELKASNEEVMSMNEELQSANEEMETSKEELQSLNEELSTVNSQLQEKVQELEATGNDLANLMASVDTATLFLDAKHAIRRFTGQASRLFRIIDTDIGRPVRDIAWSFNDPELEPDADRVLQTLQPSEKEVRTEAGRWYQRRITPYRTRDDRIEGVVLTFSDVSDLKAIDAELRRLNSELGARVKERTDEVEALASRLTLAEQSERRRLSHFLHDDLQQLLYSAEMKLALLRQNPGPSAPEASRKTLDEIYELVRRSIEATRKLAVDLSPPVLRDEGLVPMLIWLGSQIREAHGLQVVVNGARGRYSMSEGMRVLLYQATRELLFNVVKHASAKQATVDISLADGALRIGVTDDGRGFDPKKIVEPTSPEHFGLNSLRERLSLFAGNLGIESQPGGGSRVSIQVPRARLSEGSP